MAPNRYCRHKASGEFTRRGSLPLALLAGLVSLHRLAMHLKQLPRVAIWVGIVFQAEQQL